ncbi:MAG TPA: exodeoxyribonuclease VII small subunit [Steroidobacteraceae bacterium]|jgi:exodeoxyribonuclease VII small subunit|nr:exodeoxyribonuclease VII small subunit [Steroidobacteraceae bacterium]
MSAAADSADVSTTAAVATTAAPAFEQTLAELEALVAQLESGDLPLDEALRTFEQGVRLTRDCQAALSSAQQKVQLLLQRGENAVIEEFDASAIERLSVSAGLSPSPEL